MTNLSDIEADPLSPPIPNPNPSTSGLAGSATAEGERLLSDMVNPGPPTLGLGGRARDRVLSGPAVWHPATIASRAFWEGLRSSLSLLMWLVDILNSCSSSRRFAVHSCIALWYQVLGDMDC